MDTPAPSRADRIKQELLSFPKRAREYDETWKRLCQLFPKTDFHNIRSQHQWNDFFATIPPEVLRSFSSKAINDPLLWQYGPISQHQDVQQAISLSLATTASTDQEGETSLREASAINYSAFDSREEGADNQTNTEEKNREKTFQEGGKQLSQAAPTQSSDQHLETAFIDEARNQLRARNPGKPISEDDVQLLAHQLKRHAMSGQRFQRIREHAASSKDETILSSSPITSTTIGDRIDPFLTTQQEQGRSTAFSPESFSQSDEEEMSHENVPDSESQSSRAGPGYSSRPPFHRKGSGFPSFSPRGLSSVGQIAKVARFGAFLWPWGIIIIAVVLFLLIIIVILSEEDEAAANVSVRLETSQLEVEALSDEDLEILKGCQSTAYSENIPQCEELYKKLSQQNQGGTLGISDVRTVLGAKDNPSVLGYNLPFDLDVLLEKLNTLLEKTREILEKSVITYTITVSYPGKADDVRVTYPINPDEAIFLSATGICKLIKDSQNRITAVEWSMKENQGVDQSTFTRCAIGTDTIPTPTYHQNSEKNNLQNSSTQKVDITKYFGPPYYLPKPNGPSDINFSEEQIKNANTLGAAIARIQPYLRKRFPPTHTDPFLAVMWTMAIEGSGADPYFWNCNETYKGKENISRGCRGWYNSGNWQVGYGIQVAQASSHLAEDFKEIYGSSDASKVQEVGNRVIKNGGITNPSTMPAKSVEQLVQEAGKPGTIFQYRPTTDTEAAAQQAIAILLMDPAIGAASIAQEVAGDIGNNWAATMRSWGQNYYINGLDPNNPIFSNRIKLLAEKYTGEDSLNSGSDRDGSSFSPLSFQIKILPIKKNTTILGQARAVVIGGRGGSLTNSTSTETGNAINIGTSGTTKGSPPNTTTCGGKYSLNNPMGKNFGDPDCNFTKDDLYSLLKQYDPENADYWFSVVVPCESSYNPNALQDPSVAVDPAGAWGLYQMGRGKNGEYDHGDVAWPQQTFNATTYRRNAGKWTYWACAKDRW